MRIAIIAHGLRGGGGISVGQNIISSLGRIAPENQYLVTVPSDLGYEKITSKVPNCEAIIFKNILGYYYSRTLFECHALPKKFINWEPDVILGLGNMGLYGRFDIPQAILCHNPYLWHGRRHYGQTTKMILYLMVWLQRRCLAKDLRQTQLLLCQTEAATKRIQDKYGYKGKTALCPNAVSRFTLDENESPEVLDLVKPYRDCLKLFYLTRYYPHKNLEVLIDLFDKYRDELSSVVMFLTIAADHHAGAAKLLQSIDRKGLNDRIINVGPLPQESLGAYFRNMDALIMPTLLESFSGSYLEAMHFGLPILTSDLDFAHEVCGDSAIYFDPWDAEAVKNAILKLKRNPELAEDLVSKGKAQLQTKFRSWDQITETLLHNLQDIVSAAKT